MPEHKILLLPCLADALKQQHPALTAHGLNYAVNTLLAERLHLDPPATPTERRAAAAVQSTKKREKNRRDKNA